MTKKTASTFASLVLILAVVFTVCGWRPFHAHVIVNSAPEGASVYENGKLLGTTPYKTHILHGTKNFVLKMDGFFDQPIVVDYHSSEHVQTKLKSMPVLVYTKPTAEIYKATASKPIGTTPIDVDVYLEERTYTLKAADHFDKEITIGLDTQSPLVVELEPKPVITIKTSPADAKIYMVGNDELLGTGSLVLILEAKAGFEIKADRYYSKTINLEPKTQAADVTLRAMPYVMITSKPIGANVTIDGKPVGTTPVEQLIEKAATAKLSLDGYVTKTVTLNGTDLSPVIALEKVPPPPEPKPEPVATNAAPAAL